MCRSSVISSGVVSNRSFRGKNRKRKKKKGKQKIQRDQFNSILCVARSCVFSVLAKSEDPPRGSVRSLIYVKLINRSICPFSRLCSVEFRRNNARDTDRSNLYELLLGNGFNWPTIFRGISRYHQWFANVRRQRKVRRIQSLTPDQRYRFWSQLPPFYHETNDDINWTRCSRHESDFVVKYTSVGQVMRLWRIVTCRLLPYNWINSWNAVFSCSRAHTLRHSLGVSIKHKEKKVIAEGISNVGELEI